MLFGEDGAVHKPSLQPWRRPPNLHGLVVKLAKGRSGRGRSGRRSARAAGRRRPRRAACWRQGTTSSEGTPSPSRSWQSHVLKSQQSFYESNQSPIGKRVPLVGTSGGMEIWKRRSTPEKAMRCDATSAPCLRLDCSSPRQRSSERSTQQPLSTANVRPTAAARVTPP